MTAAAPNTLFGIRDYRHLFTAQVVALFGTGLSTVALGLLAYQLAGRDAAVVLGNALAIKMIGYVIIAPLAAAHCDRLPRRLLLVGLDLVRATAVLALPFVDQIWQIYLLIAVLHAASAAFTPTFQAAIPDVVTDEMNYTRALSASQLAATMESLISPVLAALALSVWSFHWLFLGTVVGFLLSAALVLTTKIPDAIRPDRGRAWDRTLSGIRIYLATPRLRGVLALNLTVACAGSIVMVTTVNYVTDVLGGTRSDVAWLLAASGAGTMAVAVVLPPILQRVTERTVMLAGGAALLLGVGGAIESATAASRYPWTVAAVSWAILGIGMGLTLTPVGRILRRSAGPADRPALFAAQFSLSHLCWLLAYPIAGWGITLRGFSATWSVLSVLAGIGILTALVIWPRHDPDVLVHRSIPGRVDHLPTADATPVPTGLPPR